MAPSHDRSKSLGLLLVTVLAGGAGCIELDDFEGRSCEPGVVGRGCLSGFECVERKCVLPRGPQSTFDAGVEPPEPEAPEEQDAGTTPPDAGAPPPFDGGVAPLPFTENFETFPTGTWAANSQQGRWRVLDAGTAAIVQDGTRAVRLEAPFSGSGNARPRSLILSPVDAADFDATVRVRIPGGEIVPANGVELRWRYRGPDHFLYLSIEKYFPLDTVIMELGANGQAGTKRTIASGVPAGFTTVRVRHSGGQVDVFVNGVQEMSLAQPAALDGGVFGIAGYGSGATFDDVSITVP